MILRNNTERKGYNEIFKPSVLNSMLIPIFFVLWYLKMFSFTVFFFSFEFLFARGRGTLQIIMTKSESM